VASGKEHDIRHFPLQLAAPVTPVGKLDVVAPFDGSLIATVDMVGTEGVEEALAVAASLHRNRSNWPGAEQRIAILRRSADLLAERAEMFATEAAREGGKPLVDSRIEVARAIDGLRNCAELLRSGSGTEIPMGITGASCQRLAFTTHEPIGVVVAVSAFNHPLNLIVHQVGPAVAAGCPVVVKPAEDTPLSCLRLVGLLREAGLPAGWVQALLTDKHESAEQLVTDPRVAFFSFIGSARVGWHLRSKLAPGTRCALEHGGAAPVIVDRGVLLDEVVPLLAKGGFYHAGQVCVSVQRVFVHRDIAEVLARQLATAGAAMQVGDPLLNDTGIGPLIRPRETERVHEWVTEAVDRGAECLAGGEPLSDSCYPATVLFNPPLDVRVSQQEIFGPVICVYPYDDVDDAIQEANNLPYAFQAAVFTKDIDFALGVASRLTASAVMVNDHSAFRVDWMPFAGLRKSGLGVSGIPYTFHDMRQEKLLVLHSAQL